VTDDGPQGLQLAEFFDDINACWLCLKVMYMPVFVALQLYSYTSDKYGLTNLIC